MHAIELAHVEQGTPEWLEIRKSGLGGSDAATAMGLNPWKTPYALWLDKTGQAPALEENAAMKWGKIHEAAIRQEYAEQSGETVRLPECVFQHPKHKFMLASIDGVTDSGRLLEVKTTRNGSDWGEPGTDEVPSYYLTQVQHYLAVLGLEVADVAVLIQGSDFRRYEVPADAELQQMIIEAEYEFWQRVINNDPPEAVTVAEATQKYKIAGDAAVEAPQEIIDAHNKLIEIRESLKLWKEKEDEAKALIMGFMGEHSADTLTLLNKPIVTWKQAKGAARLDSKALKDAHPDIVKQFTTVSEPTRRFLIK